jgi:hypothetical protein
VVTASFRILHPLDYVIADDVAQMVDRNAKFFGCFHPL